MATADPLYNPALTGGSSLTLAASTLAGRGSAAGSGDAVEITLGTNLSMSGTTLNANAGSGAPSGAEYIVGALHADLSAERVATDTATIDVVLSPGVAEWNVIDASITAAKLASDAVTTVKVLDANITAAKLAADSVTTAKITDLNVTTAKINDLAVTTGKLAANAVTNAKFRAGAALSVVGVTGAAGADVADIAAAAADVVLRVNAAGNALAFGTVAAGGLASDSVTTAKILDANVTAAKLAADAVETAKVLDANITYAKIQNGGALSVAGRSANSAGVMADISAVAASGAVLRESGSTIGFGTIVAAGIASDAITTAKILDANVTFAKIENGSARSLLGRAANSAGVHASIAGGGAGTYASDNATSVAFRAVTDIIENLNISGDITPAQITANQNDYNPTGLSTAVLLRLDTDANRTITGLAGGADGRLIIIDNIGSNPITFSNQDTGSTAGNRFNFGYSLVVLPGRSLTIQYDPTASRWRHKSGGDQVPQTLTDGATITPNLDAGRRCKVTLAGNRTLAAPTGAKYDGMPLEIEFIQDGTGSRTITHNTGAGAYEASVVPMPTLSTGASKRDRALYIYSSTGDRFVVTAFTRAAA